MPLTHVRGIFSFRILLPLYYLFKKEAEHYESTRPFLNSNNIALWALLLLQRYKFYFYTTTGSSVGLASAGMSESVPGLRDMKVSAADTFRHSCELPPENYHYLR